MSGKLLSASIRGPQGGTSIDQNKQGINLVGNSTESSVTINNIENTASLDIGSCISTISETFFIQSFSEYLDLKPVDDILHIECADGQQLSYQGYVEAELEEDGLPELNSQFCIFLVVPETNYNSKTTVL